MPENALRPLKHPPLSSRGRTVSFSVFERTLARHEKISAKSVLKSAYDTLEFRDKKTRVKGSFYRSLFED